MQTDLDAYQSKGLPILFPINETPKKLDDPQL